MPAIISEHLDVSASPWPHIILSIPGYNTTAEIGLKGTGNDKGWVAEAKQRDYEKYIFFEKMILKYGDNINEDTRMYIKNGVKSIIPAGLNK